MMTVVPVAFRFNVERHEYSSAATGEIFPHVSGMLEAAGEKDGKWSSVEACERGSAVHELTADYDLGALDLATVEAPLYKGYLLAHVKAMGILRPEILKVEEPFVHPVHRYGTRPDRIVILEKRLGVFELKTGAVEPWHQIQTALQAIAIEHEYGVPPETIERHCLYLKENGRFKLYAHDSKRDFVRARNIIRDTCHR
jgi:hypothetical protein